MSAVASRPRLTREMRSFIYGGYNKQRPTETTYSSVHVLSLPAFHWTTIAGSANRDRERHAHVCAVVGNRHLLSRGGLRQETDGVSWDRVDPFPRGIGIFDMSSLEWTHEYNASAAPYEQNQRTGLGTTTGKWEAPYYLLGLIISDLAAWLGEKMISTGRRQMCVGCLSRKKKAADPITRRTLFRQVMMIPRKMTMVSQSRSVPSPAVSLEASFSSPS